MNEIFKTGVGHLQRRKIYRSHFGVEGAVEDKRFSFDECFVKCNLLNCSSDARSHKDCNLFTADIDEPLTAISWLGETLELSV